MLTAITFYRSLTTNSTLETCSSSQRKYSTEIRCFNNLIKNKLKIYNKATYYTIITNTPSPGKPIIQMRYCGANIRS